eukprot:5791676-Alexandrium_andersonii.AAC.1
MVDEVMATAQDTRPLSLPNTDAKLFALAVLKPLAAAVSPCTHASQRGFAKGRTLADDTHQLE